VSEIYHIAIDGPVASGKGTIARELSYKLGIPCLDTGALYRGIAVYIRNIGTSAEGKTTGKKKQSGPYNLDPNNEQAVTNALKSVKMDVEIKAGVTNVSINGIDVTSQLRDNDISQITSVIATYPDVRKVIVAKSQEIAKTSSFILEGRDTSSVLLPDAKYKFYLTANVRTRAKRRIADLAAKGETVTMRDMKQQIKERDLRDSTKGGLRKVREAIVINNSRMNVEKTIDKFMKHLIAARVGENKKRRNKGRTFFHRFVGK